MSRTVRYARLHVALANAAAAHKVEPMVARVALAVWERAGDATSHELEADLMCEGSAVRRALGRMYERELAIGTAPNGGRRRPGLVTRVRLTDEGRRMVQGIVLSLDAWELRDQEREAAAA